MVTIVTAQDGKTTPRPSANRAAWLLSDGSAMGRLTVSAEQYEQLRAEALGMRAELEGYGKECASCRHHFPVETFIRYNRTYSNWCRACRAGHTVRMVHRNIEVSVSENVVYMGRKGIILGYFLTMPLPDGWELAGHRDITNYMIENLVNKDGALKLLNVHWQEPA